MRLLVSVLAAAAIFFGASTASAVEFNLISDQNVFVEAPGEEFTIELTITNSGLVPIDFLGVSMWGYTGGVAEFVSGSAVGSFLNIVEFDGRAFGGLPNFAGWDAGDGTRTLGESPFGDSPNRVQIALAASPRHPVLNADGAADRGLDGELGTTQFSVTFSAIQSGIINIGTGFPGDGLSTGGVDTQLPNIAINVGFSYVPEPGTALLLGLGLAGLASTGRRE